MFTFNWMHNSRFLLTTLAKLYSTQRTFQSIPTMSLSTPQKILDFWFGEDRSVYNDPSHIKYLMGVWFNRTKPEVETTFVAEADQIRKLVKSGDLGEEWFTPEGYLARIVMFDQGSRTAFRGTAEAFAFDAAAEELTLEVINKGWFFGKYLPVERQTLILPLLHSESIQSHNVAGEYVLRLCEGAEDPEMAQFFKGVPYFLAEHTKVIAKYGRFPSRNAALGRTNTAEEEEYLNSPDLPAWAKSQAKA